MKPTVAQKAKKPAPRKKPVFTPDTRGVGGKQLVVEILALHQYRLNKIKSTIKTQPPPPKIKGQGQYSTNAFKIGFSGPPSTYNLAPKLSQARRVHSDQSEAEHQNRREHMHRRMQEYPNRKDREQNQMDPVAHPVLLIRSDDGGPKRVFYANPFDSTDMRPIAAAASPGAISRSASTASPFKRPGTAMDGSGGDGARSTANLYRPNTAPNKDGFMFSRSVPSLRNRSRSPSPGRHASEEHKVSGGSDPYARLKQKLLSLIVEHRIYREANLKQLFDKAIAINSHLDHNKLQAVINELRTELEVDLAGGERNAAAGGGNRDSKHSAASASAAGGGGGGGGGDGDSASASASGSSVASPAVAPQAAPTGGGGDSASANTNPTATAPPAAADASSAPAPNPAPASGAAAAPSESNANSAPAPAAAPAPPPAAAGAAPNAN